MPEINSLNYAASREQLQSELTARHAALKQVLKGIGLSDYKDPALEELTAVEQRIYPATDDAPVHFWIVRFEPTGARIIHEEAKGLSFARLKKEEDRRANAGGDERCR